MSIRNQIKTIAATILKLGLPHPIRIGIDGFCAAGKTTFADQLEILLSESGRNIIRATADDFQNPPEIRWQLGQQSPQGFYRDAIDFDSLRNQLLEPLGPRGNLCYRTTIYDIRNLKPNLSPVMHADQSSILIVDGLFLLNNKLRSCWDFSIYIETEVEKCIARAIVRNQEQLDSANEIERQYRIRYAPGYQMYLDQEQPQVDVDAIVFN